jgi:hypothetical protein
MTTDPVKSIDPGTETPRSVTSIWGRGHHAPVLSLESKAAIARLGAPTEATEFSSPAGPSAEAEPEPSTPLQESPMAREPHPARFAFVWDTLAAYGFGLMVLGVFLWLVGHPGGDWRPPGPEGYQAPPEPSGLEQAVGSLGVPVMILGLVLVTVSPAPLMVRGVPWLLRILGLIWTLFWLLLILAYI